LAKATKLKAELPSFDKMNWNDWVIGQALFREAKNTIEP
jgi:hypothetical protein